MTRPNTVSPELWASLSEGQRRFVIYHETMHALLAMGFSYLGAHMFAEAQALS